MLRKCVTCLLYLSSEPDTQYTLDYIISLRLYHVHRDGDIEMGDNTAYGMVEAQYEDVKKL